RLSLSSTGGTDGGTTEGGGGDFGNQCADGSYADDSTDEGSTNIAKAEATGTGAEGESEPAMPEEVFKWMAHTVNQDFIRLGYPTILTKSADQEYVSLCPLIRNCSSVLTLLKARRCSSADASATAASAAADSTTATSAGGVAAASTLSQGSTARSDYAFVRSTWRSFRKLAQQRIAESAELAKRAEELQRQLTDANMEIEQLRTSINSSNNQQSQQQPASTSIASAQEAAGGGRLQRVGGFLRRAVSRERLTFGRSASRLDASTTPNHPQQLQQQQWPSRPQSDTRSRASSQPPPSSSIAVANHRGVEDDSELHRIRAEFDRRERLLLAERERLRQANSKLTFRIQYLSGVASAAAKQQQQHQQQQQQSNPSFKTDRRLRRAERRVSELQRETSSLRKSLGEKTDALKSITSAAAQLQRHSDETADTKPDHLAPPAPPPVDEPSRLAKFVESICHVACTRLQRLQRQCTDAEARVAALTEC
uniref:Calponin-homology (CH) domain-containing protein n=1 Tax=Macrostomum lignano TaxID=282301 RepID=A0A1I8H2D2_9PLAT